MKQFTSHLDFSLTRKRLRMMGKKMSRFNVVASLTFLIPILSTLFMMFCTKSSNEPIVLTSEEIWAMVPPTHYNDIELTTEGLIGSHPFDDRSGLYVGPDGKPYTGVQNSYLIDSDRHESQLFFVDGKNVRSEFYRYDDRGVYENKGVVEYSLNVDGNLVRTIFSDKDSDTLRLATEIIYRDSLTAQNIYHLNGHLAVSGSSRWDSTLNKMVKEGVYFEYDENGTLRLQEIYENGNLVEKIK